MTYRKHGGIHFVKLGRFGCSFYVKRKAPKPPRSAVEAFNVRMDMLESVLFGLAAFASVTAIGLTCIFA